MHLEAFTLDVIAFISIIQPCNQMSAFSNTNISVTPHVSVYVHLTPSLSGVHLIVWVDLAVQPIKYSVSTLYLSFCEANDSRDTISI